jgi:hypothetical protein
MPTRGRVTKQTQLVVQELVPQKLPGGSIEYIPTDRATITCRYSPIASSDIVRYGQRDVSISGKITTLADPRDLAAVELGTQLQFKLTGRWTATGFVQFSPPRILVFGGGPFHAGDQALPWVTMVREEGTTQKAPGQ